MLLSSLLVFLLILQVCLCQISVVALQGQYTTSTFSCIKAKGYNKTTITINLQSNSPNTNDIQNVVNALNSGLAIDYVFLPCRGNEPQNQAKQIFSVLDKFKSKNSRLWLAPSAGRESVCNWHEAQDNSNCQFMINLGSQLIKMGLKTGLALYQQGWDIFFRSACPQSDSYFDLLWINFDSIPNFKNYQQIGKWKTPTAKIYDQDDTLCGGIFGFEYQP